MSLGLGQVQGPPDGEYSTHRGRPPAAREKGCIPGGIHLGTVHPETARDPEPSELGVDQERRRVDPSVDHTTNG